MGIVNATPDSFYNQGIENSERQILYLVEKMIAEGATLIDIGGMSTKPGAAEVSQDEELKRVIPVIEKVKDHFPDAFISIDTFRSEVAKLAIEAGADIINDISGAEWDATILNVAAEFKTPYIAMHIQGRPETMQQNPTYENVTTEVYDFFVKKIQQCRQMKVVDVIADPGFGFGKTVDHNYELLYNLPILKQLHIPILVGISRKSMICKPLKVNPVDALNGTSALHMLALQNGANILRVHDVKEAIQCIKLFENYQEHAV